MIGTTVAHYEIIEKLGSGGMGVVYKARDTKLNRFAALKFLPQDLDVSKSGTERFIREAQSASALDHPNICTVYEIGETEDGHLYIAMAYYDGVTLKSMLSTGPLTLRQTQDLTLQIARGLQKAHAQNIIHRDVKPANVMITSDGIAKLLDFGLAKSQGAALTKPGTVMGTVSYMSPEQAQSQFLDRRTDIWSLGVVMYEMLTGISPFKKNNEAASIYSIVYKEPERISAVRKDLPPEFASIVMKCLFKNPDERYQSMDELIADLKRMEPLPETAAVIVADFFDDEEESSATLTMPAPILELDAQKHGAAPAQPSGQTQKQQQAQPAVPVQPAPKKKRSAVPFVGVVMIAAIAAYLGLSDFGRSLFRASESPAPAIVAIDSQPAGATVILDGDSIGVTPLQDLQLQNERPHLQIKKSGFIGIDSTVRAPLGQRVSFSFMLAAQPLPVEKTASIGQLTEQKPPAEQNRRNTEAQLRTSSRSVATPTATLTLQAVPSGSVRIVDHSASASVGTPLAYNLQSGTYTVQFQHPQFGTIDTTLVLTAGQRQYLTCYFESYLNVQSLLENENPIWASVVINGRNTGETTPMADYVLAPGQYTISVAKTGYDVLEKPQVVAIKPAFSRQVIRLVFHIDKQK